MAMYSMHNCRLHSCKQCAVQLTECPPKTGVSCCHSHCLAQGQEDLRAAQWFKTLANSSNRNTMRTRCEQDAAHHAVATHTAMMRSRRPPDVTAAAIFLVSPACAMHPLALHITLVLRRAVTCAATAQLMTEGLIRQGQAVNLALHSCWSC